MMAKDEEESYLGTFLTTFFETIMDGFFKSVRNKLSEVADGFMDTLSIRLERSARRMMINAMYYSMLMLGVVLASIGIIRLMIDFLQITAGLAYIIIAALVFLLASIIKLSITSHRR